MIIAGPIIRGIHVVQHHGILGLELNRTGYINNVADGNVIITTGDGNGHLLIDTTALVISNSYGISLNQLLTISQGGNNTFINLKVPVDGFVGGIEGGRKGADIVGSIGRKSKSVVVACIGIREGK